MEMMVHSDGMECPDMRMGLPNVGMILPQEREMINAFKSLFCAENVAHRCHRSATMQNWQFVLLFSLDTAFFPDDRMEPPEVGMILQDVGMILPDEWETIDALKSLFCAEKCSSRRPQIGDRRFVFLFSFFPDDRMGHTGVMPDVRMGRPDVMPDMRMEHPDVGMILPDLPALKPHSLLRQICRF